MNEKIFVSIASYLDYELPFTILDCILKSKNPENLSFGVCLQYDDNELTNKNILDFYEKKFNIKISKYHYSKSEGGCWARQKAQKFYRNEKYSLQVDSHTRFIHHWDAIVKKDYYYLQKKGFEKPLITFLPPPYRRFDSTGIDYDFSHLNKLDYMNIPMFKYISEDYWLDYVGYSNEKHINFQPTPIKILYGGFVFSSGDWVKNIEQDPEHYYTGEELALSIRSYTHGYDLFTPSQIIAWHRSHSSKPKKHINNNPEHIVHRKHKKAMERLRKLIHQEYLGKYSLGSKRTLKEYEDYIGVDFMNRKIYDKDIQKKQ